MYCVVPENIYTLPMNCTPIPLEIPVLVDTILKNFGFEIPRVGINILWNHTLGLK